MAYIDTKYIGDCDTCRHYWDGFGCDTYCDNGGSYRPNMDKIPTADVVEVKHGEWKKISVASEHGYGQVYYQHSSCEINSTELFQCPYERCPRCGAKMDGEKNEM